METKKLRKIICLRGFVEGGCAERKGQTNKINESIRQSNHFG
jgi:hypothetical protein